MYIPLAEILAQHVPDSANLEILRSFMQIILLDLIAVPCVYFVSIIACYRVITVKEVVNTPSFLPTLIFMTIVKKKMCQKHTSLVYIYGGWSNYLQAKKNNLL